MKLKKEIATLLLASALLTSSLTACQKAPDGGNEIDNTTPEITTENTTPESPDKSNNQESNLQNIPSTEDFINIIACNGAYYNSPIRYVLNASDDLILYIPEWNEFFIIPKSEDMYFVAETVESSCAVLSENECTLFFRDFSPEQKPTNIIRFTRGNSNVTVQPLNISVADYSYSFKYCNFINEKTGYLFLFGGSDIELSHLLKTTDGGETWVEQPIETSFSMDRKEDVICAKMLDENVGVIAGRHYADDYSKRTFITADGGKTWSSVDIVYPTSVPNLGLGGESACDLLYENGKYVLVYRFRSYKDGNFHSYVYLKYASTDLINWTLVEE